MQGSTNTNRWRTWDLEIGFNSYDEGGAIWTLNADDTWSVWASPYQWPCTFGEPVQLAAARGYDHARLPDFAMSESGDGVVVWQQTTTGLGDLWAAEYRAGTGWTLGSPVTQGVHGPVVPEVAMDRGGNATVVDYESSPVAEALNRPWALSWDRSGGWRTPELLGTLDATHGQEPTSLSVRTATRSWFGTR